MSRLELKNIGRQYGQAQVLEALNLEIGPGEIVAITGPSGAGKTTTCRMIAGLEFPSEGEILFDGRSAKALSPQERDAAFMFESYALYPHFTVFENIAFPLMAPRCKTRYTAAKIESRVNDLMQLVDLGGLQARFPNELSGGQKQRVALCRALVQEPRIYLLDEPISHLDAKLNYRLRGEIRRRLAGTETPTLWTTPNALEALSIADRVAILVRGRVQQQGTPQEIYRRPANLEVARLVGDPPLNLLTGSLKKEGARLVFQHPGFQVSLGKHWERKLELQIRREKITLGIRPTEVEILEHAEGDEPAAGEVYIYEPFGKYGILSVRLGGDVVKVKSSRLKPYGPGDPVKLRFEESSFLVFDEDTGRMVQ